MTAPAMRHNDLPLDVESVGRTVLDAGYTVHSALGPGLLERVYEACLRSELESRGLSVRQQVPLSVVYAGRQLRDAFRVDLLVNDKVIVEVKAVEQVIGVHLSQIDTYLAFAGCELGFLLNFNTPYLARGVFRRVRTDRASQSSQLRSFAATPESSKP